VTQVHKPSSRQPLLSVRPLVTFPASWHHHRWLVPISTALELMDMCVNDLSRLLHDSGMAGDSVYTQLLV